MVLYHCKLGFKVIMKRLLHGSRLYITQIYYCTRNMSTVRPANPFEAISCEAGFIKEGSATIKFPKGEVFYNPVQQLNRDLSIIAINCFSEDYLALKKKRFLSGITVLEALAATGLRSIRYAKEISSASLIIANDMDPDAVKLINENIQLNSENDPNNRMNIIRSNCGDAIATMHKLKTEGINIDVIDLDPYGSAAPFLDSAVQNISDGGLLCVTCTDKVILCSSHHDTCFSRYGGIPIQGDSCHEAALRLVIQAVDSAANKYRKTVVPLMSCSIDFYVRIFLKIIESPATVKLSCTKRGTVSKCVQCKTFFPRSFVIAQGKPENPKFHPNPSPLIGEKCPVCNSRVEVCGPLWIGPLHDKNFVKKIIEKSMNVNKTLIGTHERVAGLASIILEEMDTPLFYSLPEIAKFLKSCVPPLLTIKSAILNAGFNVTGSHCEAQALKTDADPHMIWNIVIKWLENNAPVKKLYEDKWPQKKLVDMIKNLNLPEPSFEYNPGSNPQSRDSGLKRFPANPTKNWGPLARAKKKKSE